MSRRTGKGKGGKPRQEQPRKAAGTLAPSRVTSTLGDSTHPLTIDELARKLRVPAGERRALARLVTGLVQVGKVVRIKGGRLALPRRINLVTGRYRIKADGFGAVDDLSIPPARSKGAMPDDLVVARVEGSGPRGRPSGSVVRVVERARSQVVGLFTPGKGVAFARPVDPRMGSDVVIPKGGEGKARAGQVVVVSLTDYPEEAGPAQGKVSAILGFPGDPGVETAAIVHARGLPLRFPEGAAAEAERIPEPGPAALRGREDLRAFPFVTIDGEKARDFDDALCAIPCHPDPPGLSMSKAVEGRPGGIRLLVAIADVSHFVKPGSSLDREAAKRGNSVYFPDLVIPMLPERLSNGLCSLRPGEDRLVFACEADLTPGGEVLRHRFFPAVIRSAARLTYHQVEDHLEKGLTVKAVPAAVRSSLALLAQATRSLMAGRRRAGSLDFDLPEPDITLDLTGQVENIARSERLFAHRLVEECMLLANRLAAGDILAAGAEGVYRVHEAPAPDKVEELGHILAPLGFVPPRTGPGARMASPAFFQRILDGAAGTPRERFLNTVVLRSMKRALYTTRPLGHFGLALAHYTHFTSPIRRYADLLVHRILRGARGVGGFDGFGKLTAGKLAARGEDEAAPALEGICEHVSATELAADEAERELLAVLRARFMEDKLGEEYTGVVSGVTAFGFFVELSDFFVDGLVRLSSLGDDYYVFRERELALVGEHSGRVFRLGDLVRVRVARVDVVRRHLDFELREKIG